MGASAEQSDIPGWIKNNAKWWAEETITDSDFLNGMQYLIDNEILSVPKLTSTNTYAPPDQGQTLMVKISGNIDNYVRGGYVELRIITPTHFEITLSTVTQDEGYYETSLDLGYHPSFGTYRVTGTHDGKDIPEWTFFVENQQSSIPQWIRNNAGWWSDGSISDKDFISGIQFLVNNRIIKVKNSPSINEVNLGYFFPTKEELGAKNWKTWDKKDYDWGEFTFNESDKIELTIKKTSTSDPTLITLLKFDDSNKATNFFSFRKEYGEDFRLESSADNEYPIPIGDCFDSITGKAVSLVCNVNDKVLIIMTSKDNQENAQSGIKKVGEVMLTKLNDGIPISLGSSKSEREATANVEAGFSGTYCKQEYGYVIMTGKFTNGPIPYSLITLKLGVEDNTGTIVAVGLGTISNIGANQTKLFEATAPWDGPFESCLVEIDDAYP